MDSKVWLIGSGTMALDYSKVLDAQRVDYLVVGRGDRSADEFEQKTQHSVIRGGLTRFLSSGPAMPRQAIVSVGVEELKNTSLALVRFGVRQLLVEKPAGLNSREIEELRQAAEAHDARVYIGYNRRFYSSVEKAWEMIESDGGVISFNFEFTEWSHVIKNMTKASGVMAHWFLGNSTHVVDLAFYLGGRPEKIECFTAGSLPWHPAAAVFAGAGISDRGALFSYQANWEAPGRWGVEMLTRKHRLIFRPLEKLQVQQIGSVNAEFIEIDDRADIEFKPGLYKQVDWFLNGKTNKFCTVQEQSQTVEIYNRIAGY